METKVRAALSRPFLDSSIVHWLKLIQLWKSMNGRFEISMLDWRIPIFPRQHERWEATECHFVCDWKGLEIRRGENGRIMNEWIDRLPISINCLFLVCFSTLVLCSVIKLLNNLMIVWLKIEHKKTYRFISLFLCFFLLCARCCLIGESKIEQKRPGELKSSQQQFADDECAPRIMMMVWRNSTFSRFNMSESFSALSP